MTGRSAISIRVNENWGKADRRSLQIGASGVKLQEYANYLNWSRDGFLDNQFDQTADRVTRVALHGHQTGRLQNWLQQTKRAKSNFLCESNSVSSCQVVDGAADMVCKQWCFSWFN